jgi:hypothetical protein
MQATPMSLLELLRASGRIEPRASTDSAAINKELQDFERYLTEIYFRSVAAARSRVAVPTEPVSMRASAS